mgnify:CR=1 FL=1
MGDFLYRNKLLGKGNSRVIKYTSSLTTSDVAIVKEVITVLMAHTRNLARHNLIPGEVADKVIEELKKLHDYPEPLFAMEAEDVHEAIEMYLKNRLGSDAGWIALGKSRNDHVAAALRLKSRKELIKLLWELLSLREVLLEMASRYERVLMPAFTHLQPAQVTTFAHYLLSFDEELSHYMRILRFIINEVLSESPLGAGAGTTTNVPVSRYELARELGFSRLVINSIRATGSRDFIMVISSILTCISLVLSRLAEDFIIFSTPQFNYISVGAEFQDTSSLMPHKRNLIVMEIARAWGAESLGHLMSILAIIKGLPTGYNLDLQEINKHFIYLGEKTIETIAIVRDMLKSIKVNEEHVKADITKHHLLTTDYTELLALKLRKPYREVYELIASLIRHHKGVHEVYKKLSSQLGRTLHPEEVINKPHEGSPNPYYVRKYINEALKEIEDFRRYLGSLNKHNVANIT